MEERELSRCKIVYVNVMDNYSGGEIVLQRLIHNLDGELFGNERLKALFLDKEHHRFQHIINSINQFTLGKDQDDDVSLVEISL